ncbi:MAG: ABC transporter substrate-binding protein [Chloroflexi bacterium]|nr:ABC transporter substrate-binding protein [Chloroflexota bacterium]
MSSRSGRRWLPWAAAGSTIVLLLVVLACQTAASATTPINVGLIAPLSGSSASSGEAIQRGMLLAIDEINRSGGVLGRPLAVVTRDVDNDPAAGIAAVRELVASESVVAVFGGKYSPVMRAQLDVIHELRVPLINTWGSLNAITNNGRAPNYAFGVTVNDVYADEFLVRYAVDVIGARRPGIMADANVWGEANAKGLSDWLVKIGAPAAGVERFAEGDTSMLHQLEKLRAAGADSILLVANAPEGGSVVRGLGALGWKVPVVSHWSVSSGQFVERGGVENTEGVLTLQTYSFFGRQSPKGEAVLRAYNARFGTRSVAEVQAPVGVAHGYDALHLLARAIRKSGTTGGPEIRAALEGLDPYEGLIKRYAPAFTRESHDALQAEDYLMTTWKSGELVPAARPGLK